MFFRCSEVLLHFRDPSEAVMMLGDILRRGGLTDQELLRSLKHLLANLGLFRQFCEPLRKIRVVRDCTHESFFVDKTLRITPIHVKKFGVDRERLMPQ